MDRLERFRACVARLDPAANPGQALREALYVEPPPRGLAQRLALAMQLAPSSARLVLGGIGSGKTTEALVATGLLQAAPDTRAVYVDVSQHHDLGKALPGVLVVLAGLELAKLVPASGSPEIEAARQRFVVWARGYGERVDRDYGDYEPPEDDGTEYVYRPGVLHPPLPDLHPSFLERIEALRVLKAALPPPLRHFVVLFDSLDRVNEVPRFEELVVQDVRALRAAAIGTVVIGPPRVLYGTNRPITDLFDEVQRQPSLDVRNDAAARNFLSNVLITRAGHDLIPEEPRTALVRWSGGVLRDLVALARSSLEEAFLGGADAVTSDHVEQAVDRFGRAMMLGLTEDESRKLGWLIDFESFVVTTNEHLALLDSRRVLEYPGARSPFAIHPTIQRLVRSMPR